ncbi:MAG: HD domain-containing protein [Tissierellia bacterium]|nr:HD domain-containing protein [Tissierellia bacterium]
MENKYDKLNKAIDFATKAHLGIYRKGSKLPYIFHPMEVAKITSSMTDDVDIVIAALLHDTIEDCPDINADTIRREFGERVLDLILMETEDKMPDERPEDTWLKRKADTIESLKDAPIEAKIITLADKLANLRDIYVDEIKMGEEVWNKFNVKDKKLHKWYYENIIAGLSELEGEYAYREILKYFNLVFGG